MGKNKDKKDKKLKKVKKTTISVRGEALRIDATFGDSQLGQVLASLVNDVYAARRSREQPSTPLSELISELVRSLRKDQVEQLTNMFDMAQKLLFMEIVNIARPASASTTDRAS